MHHEIFRDRILASNGSMRQSVSICVCVCLYVCVSVEGEKKTEEANGKANGVQW